MRTSTRGVAIPEPVDYEFNRSDQVRYADRMWRCPVRLIRSGEWAQLWRVDGTVRGGGAAISLLPILGLQIGGPAGEAEAGWSAPAYLSRRRLAKLARMDKDTVGAGLKQLRDTGWIQIDQVRHKDPGLAGGRTRVRLSRRVLSTDQGQHVPISGAFIYGGTWSLMQPAWRQLYVAVAAEDIADRMRQKRVAQHGEWLSDMVLSYADLMDRTGLSRSALAEAVKALRTPLRLVDGAEHADYGAANSVPLIAAGEARSRQARWYTPIGAGQRIFWPTGFLEDRQAVREYREVWRAAEVASPQRIRPDELPRFPHLPQDVRDEYWELLTQAARRGTAVGFDYVKDGEKSGEDGKQFVRGSYRQQWGRVWPSIPFREPVGDRPILIAKVAARTQAGKEYTFSIHRMRRLHHVGVPLSARSR